MIGLVAIVLLAWFALRSAPQGFIFSNARQLTSGIGVQDLPDWSPDGRMLAYHSNRAGNTDIWIMQADGSSSLNRTADHIGDDMFPVWSPDGTQIAFFSERDGGGIFVMEPLAGVPRRISRKGDAAKGRPQWSRDQLSLAYEVRDGVESYVEIMELGSGETTRLRLPGQGLERPDLSWSPDGRFFAYLDVDQRGNDANRLMLLRVEDGAASVLTDEKTLEHAPHWAEDSRTLFFSSNRSGAADMWAQELRRDGQVASEPQGLTAGLLIRSAAFSPDSSRLAYSSGRTIANIWRVPVLADRLATWADAKQLTFDHTEHNVPDVSIQRRELVVGSQRGGNIDLWLLSLDGGEMRQITDDPELEGYPKWSPDGTAVTFHSLRAGTRDIYVRTVDGGPARRLTDEMGEEYLPSWSPDGTQIVFASTRSGTLDIWSVPSAGGEPSQLTTGGFHHPSWSPDGQLLAFHSDRTDEPRIWILPRGETQPAMLTSGSREGPIWSPDGREIFFTGANERAGDFWAVEVTTRTERRLTDFQGRRGQLRRHGLATDGRYIYFPWQENQSDIWVMDVERN
jgi:Tol biopolymer transport system component